MQGAADLLARKPQLAAYMDTWKTHFAAWRAHVWDVHELDALISQWDSTFPGLSRAWAVLKQKPYALQSDLGRYVIAYAQGGMYVDTDMECLRNFEHLLGSGKPAALYDSELPRFLRSVMSVTSNCWFYFPKPGSSALKHLIEAVVHRVLHGGDIKTTQVFKATGPDAFAHSLRESSSAVDYISCSTLDPVKPRNKHLAAGGPAALARFPDAYAVHHGVSSWMGGGDFLNGLTCVYGAYYEVSSILAPVFMLAFIGALVAVIVLATRKK